MVDGVGVCERIWNFFLLRQIALSIPRISYSPYIWIQIQGEYVCLSIVCTRVVLS